MQAQAGLIVGVGLEFIEFVILFFLNFALRAQPERLNGINMLAVKINGERHERAVALEDCFDPTFVGVVRAIVLELNDDLRAAAEALDLLNLITTGTIA